MECGYVNARGCGLAHGGKKIQEWTDELGNRGQHWQEDLDRYDLCINNIINAGHTPSIRMFGWMQGESDTLDLADAVKYEDRLRVYLSGIEMYFRASWGQYVHPEFCVVVGLIGACIDTLDVDEISNLMIVRSAQAIVANERSNTSMVETQDILRCPDKFHPTPLSERREIADRMIGVYKNRVLGVPGYKIGCMSTACSLPTLCTVDCKDRVTPHVCPEGSVYYTNEQGQPWAGDPTTLKPCSECAP